MGSSDRFRIIGSQEGHRSVEFWSVKRLPFEPDGWIKTARGELREAIGKLPLQAGEILHAVYRSEERSFADVENILFYNVGTGRFAGLTSQGLRFERSFIAPPPHSSMPKDSSLHYHWYAPSLPGETYAHWARGETLASWSVPSVPLRPTPSAGDVWLGMKEAPSVTTSEISEPLDYFGLTVRVFLPAGATLNLTNLVKPLFDGIIAGMHSHDGSKLDEVARRLATSLNAEPAHIRTALMDSRNAVLGKRRLLYPRGTGIQWNPADDLLVAGELHVTSDSSAEQSSGFSGELYRVRSTDFVLEGSA